MKNNGTFSVRYSEVMALQTNTEIVYSIDEHNQLTGNVQVRSITGNDINTLPYIPPFQGSIRWDRTWTDKFSSQLSTTYIGVRSTGNTSMPQLEGYVDVSLRATYSLTNAMQCYVRIDNMTNSNIFVWEGYKERGIFFAAGVLWNF
jgi:outer membrane cobalamin receptor